MEDAKHVIHDCRAYDTLRNDYMDLLGPYPTMREILNPIDRDSEHSVRTGRKGEVSFDNYVGSLRIIFVGVCLLMIH